MFKEWYGIPFAFEVGVIVSTVSLIVAIIYVYVKEIVRSEELLISKLN